MHVVLVEPEYQGNLGLIARVLKNFGSDGLVLVNPKVEPGNTAHRRAMHAQDVLNGAEVFDSLEDVKAEFDYLVGATAKTGTEYNVNRSYVRPWEVRLTERTALVIGRESHGLTNEELALCDVVTVVPTSDEYPTLNISHAVAVLLYEFSRREEGCEIADRRVREQIYEFWSEILRLLDYPEDKASIKRTIFRRVLEKGTPTGREAYGIVGVLSETIKRLKP